MQTVPNASEIHSISMSMSFDGAKYTMTYSLIKNSCHAKDISDGIFSIASALMRDDDPADRVSKFIFDVSRDRMQANAIFDILVRNEVMPEHITDIVSELIPVLD